MAAFTRANPYLDEIIEDLQHHLERHRGDHDKARQALSKDDNDWIDQELLHCMTDTRYFLSNYYAIKTEEKGFQGLYPFWDSQEIIHDEFRKMERLYGKVRAMIDKARQMGSSTYVGGEIFHKTIFTEHINTHVVAQDADQSRFIFDMYIAALDFLPWWMRPRVRYAEAGKFMDFDEKDDSLRELRPGLKTRIYVDNGNKPTGAGRGKTFKRAHLSELAFWDNPSQLTKALFPTMNATDGFYVMESTPNGRNDAWHNLWRKAEAGKIDWHPIYIPYYRRDKTYFLPIPKGEVFEPIEEELELRQQVLKKENYYIKDETFNWARNKKEEFIATDGDDKMFSQEYSTNAEESFQTSAITAYGRTLINRLAKRTENPGWVGEIDWDIKAEKANILLRPIKDPKEHIVYPINEERFHIWQKPVSGERYCMGVDVSLGNDGGDYSCVQIVKLSSGHEKDEQVACWHGLIVPEDLATIVFAIGHYYNEALAAVEVNSMGMVTNSYLIRNLEYENIYRFKRMDRLKNFLTDIIGWWTDEKSKRALMSCMSKALLSDTFLIRDHWTVDEMYDFNQDYEAEGDGAHDDYLMALHIALYCGHEGEIKENQTGKRDVGESKANVFEIKDRFGTLIASTTSQNDAQRIAKQHLGAITVRTATATATINLKGKKRRVPSDFFNTDFSPIHDGDGTAHRLYYDEGMEAEDITPDMIAEYEAQMEQVEENPEAWKYV